MKSILLTGYNNSLSIQNLVKAAHKYQIQPIVYTTKDYLQLIHKPLSLPMVDLAIHRNLSDLPLQNIWTNFASQHTIHLNQKHLQTFSVYNKIVQYNTLSKNAEIPLIPSLYTISPCSFKEISNILDCNEIIVKPYNGSLGKNITLIRSQHDLEEILKNQKISRLLFQKYISIKWDIRVLVLGKKILGAIKRDIISNKIISNISQGGSASVYQLSSDLQKLCLKTCEILSLEYAGVDILLDENEQPYIIEVNNSPQTHGFDRIHKTNTNDILIKYMLQKLDTI